MQIEYLVLFGGGVLTGVLMVGWFAWKNVRMYRLLWENEKAGYVLLTRRAMALEEERMDYGGED